MTRIAKHSFIAILLIVIVLLPACTCRTVDNKIVVSGIGEDCYGDILPCANATYNLGSPILYWDDSYVDTMFTTSIDSGDSNLYINCSTNQTLELVVPVWEDLVVNMVNAKQPAANYPTWRAFKLSQVPAFEKDAINVLYFSSQLPHSYAEGTDLDFHIHIVHADNLAGISRWHFTYSWANTDDVFPAPTSMTVSVTSPEITDYHMNAQIIYPIDGSGKEISSVLVCSIQRLGNQVDDTYNDEIYLINADFHYQVDTMGSAYHNDK